MHSSYRWRASDYLHIHTQQRTVQEAPHVSSKKISFHSYLTQVFWSLGYFLTAQPLEEAHDVGSELQTRTIRWKEAWQLSSWKVQSRSALFESNMIADQPFLSWDTVAGFFAVLPCFPSVWYLLSRNFRLDCRLLFHSKCITEACLSSNWSLSLK